MHKFLLFVFALALGAAPLRAATPLPQSKGQALHEVERTLAQEKKQQEALAGKLQGIKQELDKTRDELVKLGGAIQDNERDLAALEDRIVTLTAEQTDLNAKLEQDYSSMGDLVLALERMRRIPPESLIVRPGAPLKTAQSAMLLQSTLPAINARAEQLSANLARLQEISLDLDNDRTAALAKSRELRDKQNAMQGLVNKREKLYSSTEGDLSKHKQAVDRLSKEAKTLKDLIARLDHEEQKRQNSAASQKVAQIYGTAPPDPGAARLPAAGRLLEAYGQRNALGALSQGLTIATQPGALVVAPMGGIVRYAGHFRNYGNMVIIEHKGGYHSLIGGLEKITTSEDSRLKPGEPIGQVALTPSRSGDTTLYYELRFKGQPVNPAERFSELKS